MGTIITIAATTSSLNQGLGKFHDVDAARQVSSAQFLAPTMIFSMTKAVLAHQELRIACETMDFVHGLVPFVHCGSGVSRQATVHLRRGKI